MRGDVDQLPAVVDLLEPHPRRQYPGAVDLLDLGLDAADGGKALLPAAHQHDALDDVLVVVLPDDAETWLIADGHGGDVFDIDRGAVVRRQHRIAQIVHRVDQPDTAHDRGLGTEIDGLAADIDVAVVEGLQHLRQGEAI